MNHKQNLHIHTTYVDVKNTPEELIVEAINKRFDSIGFSEHIYIPYADSPLGPSVLSCRENMPLRQIIHIYSEIYVMKKTYFLAGVSILFWSSLATISKLLLGTMNSYQMLFVSALFAVAALIVIMLCTKRMALFKEYSLKDYATMVLIGLPGTFLYYVFLYAGTARLQASQAFIINYLWPIMSVVFACILLKEKLTARKIIAILLSFLGVVTVAGGELANFSVDALLGVLFCIGAAVSYGCFTALNQKWHYDKYMSMMVSFVVASLLSFVINLWVGEPLSLNLLQVGGLAFNGVFILAIATVTWALALDSGKTAKVSNLAYITPFVSLVWTFLFLGEPINPASVLGLVIIVLGIFIQLKDNGLKSK